MFKIFFILYFAQTQCSTNYHIFFVHQGTFHILFVNAEIKIGEFKIGLFTENPIILNDSKGDSF